MEYPTADGYRAFRELCTESLWTAYEPKLAALARANPVERMKVHLLRHGCDATVQILSRLRYPGPWSGTDPKVLKLAKQLERRFPEQVLEFYMKGLVRLSEPASRTIYAEPAAVVARLGHIWVDVLNDPGR